MNWITRLIRKLELFGRRMRAEMGAAPECEHCGDELCSQYQYDSYDNDTVVYLCDECAEGLFCLGCGSFTGGTEDIFRYGTFECSSCHGWLRDEFPEAYDDDDD